MNDYKRFIETVSFKLLVVAVIYVIILFSILVFSQTKENITKYNMTFLTFFVTSIITGTFFIIKIYIENQIGVTEKTMTKQYEEKVDSLKKDIKDYKTETNNSIDKTNKSIEELKNIMLKNKQSV